MARANRETEKADRATQQIGVPDLACDDQLRRLVGRKERITFLPHVPVLSSARLHSPPALLLMLSCSPTRANRSSLPLAVGLGNSRLLTA